MENKGKFAEILYIIDGLTLIGAVQIWAPVCQKLLELKNGNLVHMKCFYTGQALVLLALALIVLAVSHLVLKKNNWVAAACLGVFMLVVSTSNPLGIGVCASAAMSCQTTALYAKGCGIVTLLVALWQGISTKA